MGPTLAEPVSELPSTTAYELQEALYSRPDTRLHDTEYVYFAFPLEYFSDADAATFQTPSTLWYKVIDLKPSFEAVSVVPIDASTCTLPLELVNVNDV